MAAHNRKTGNRAKPIITQWSKSKKPKDRVICSVCDDPIIDSVGNKPGEDSIFCDGNCSAWLHRRCAGLSKSAFLELSESDRLFLCPHCRLNTQERELASLKDLVSNLSSHLTLVLDELKELKLRESLATPEGGAKSAKPLSYADAASAGQSIREPIASPNQNRHIRQALSGDRKFNLVIYGIHEQSKGTSKHVRSAEDLNHVTTIASALDMNVTSASIRDCVGLGKFKENHTHPVLVKFVRSSDVSSILNNRKNLSIMPDITIKPDLSPKERRVESLLLKERRILINSGVNRSKLRLRGNTLFVNNTKYGEVVDSTFQKAQSVPSSTIIVQATVGSLQTPAHPPVNTVNTSNHSTPTPALVMQEPSTDNSVSVSHPSGVSDTPHQSAPLSSDSHESI